MKILKQFTQSKGIRYILSFSLVLVFNGFMETGKLWAQNPDKVFNWDEGDSGLGFWTKAINCGINSNQPGGGRNTQGSRLTFGVDSHQRWPGVNSVEFWTNSNFEETCNQNFSAERSEMHANSTYRGLGISEGQTVWFGFSDMYTDLDFNHSATLMQFRNNCGSGSPSTEIVLSRARTAPGGERGRLYLVTPTGRHYFGEAIKENVWYDWVIEIKYSKGSDGYFKIWRAEVGSNQTLSYNNPMLVVNGNTMKGSDNCPHFRWGVYRWESADLKPSSISQADRMMVKYLSQVNLRIGSNLGANGFNSVAPEAPSGTPTPPPLPEEPTPTAEDTVCLLTADWTSQDIGTPGVQGKACKKDDTYTVHGGGNDIWGTSDNFHFLFKKMKGDVEITARMTSISQENRLTKAGLMIRKGLSASSEHILLSLDASATQSFQYRDVAGGSTFNKTQMNGAFTTPYWIKLIRRGNTVSAYYSLEGVNWQYMDQLAISLDEEAFVGLVMNSHDDALISKASFDNVSILGNTSYAPIGPEGEGVCFDSSTGRLVIEAENYATNVPGVEDAASTQWEKRTMSGASNGEAMYAVGNGFNSQDRTPGAKLDFKVSFAAAGTYYIWTRMMGSGPADDSFHAGFNDNPETYGGYGLTTLNHNAWIWVGSVLGNRVKVSIGTPGTYLFNVWVREDGVAFDKLIISDNPNYLPIGMGPTESGPCTDEPDPTDGCEEVANLALLKEARQSSQYGGGAAAIAVDGDTDGSRGPWANGSITHTLQNSQAWWEVDLGDVYEIDQIRYFGRTDCCQDRLRDAYVIASPTPFSSTDLQTTLGRSNIRYAFVANYPDSVNTVQMEKFQARYVRIQLRDNNYLSLAEVQVFGCTTPVSSQNNTTGTKFGDPTQSLSGSTRDIMTLAPNPTSGDTRLMLSNEYTGTFEAVVHDLLGRVVYRQTFNKGEIDFNYMLFMDGLTEGIYTVTVQNGTYKRTERLSIRH
ncbi:MAG: heparin lyase I family protein [Bacteroidota bacterium]